MTVVIQSVGRWPCPVDALNAGAGSPFPLFCACWGRGAGGTGSFPARNAGGKIFLSVLLF